MAANNHDNLLQLATDIAQNALSGQGQPANRADLQQLMGLVEQIDAPEAKIVALLNYAMQDEKITLDYIRSQNFPNQIVEALSALRPLEAESYEEYLDRVMSSPVSLQVKIASMSDHLTQIKSQTPQTDDQVKQVSKQEIILKRLRAALEWHLGRTVY
ncbi:hypothetical protein Pse7367_3095 [Thalassoporum mexicanum PCC 7367]|uniref:hypothetical protein n=1 Tax=Thalassoporum mexicanum TaxID=3457544 RepID=UPI00029F823F|nr:hypothetical protein [Pseudanabaena sp. PCC 7367]AFY71344.1 hypothetical protein Pse7367_3095 [Pseudanabaena sp. PCC 7367]